MAVAGVDQHNGGWRQFDYQDRRRGFASVVFRPSRRVSLTAMGESGRDRAAGLRMMTETEEMLAWFDNRAVLGASAVTFTPNNVQPTAAQRALGVVTLNGARTGTNRRVVMIENDGTVFDAIGTYLTGTYNNNTVRAPDGTPGRHRGRPAPQRSGPLSVFDECRWRRDVPRAVAPQLRPERRCGTRSEVLPQSQP
jgi:hypothetical protein